MTAIERYRPSVEVESVRAPLGAQRPSSFQFLAGPVVAAMAMIGAIVGGASVDRGDVDGLGLLRALPVVYWAAVTLAALATVLLVREAIEGSRRFIWLLPAAWLVVLHGGPHLASERTRFPTNWVHLGFVDYISETGTGDVLIDARFAWPGFFGTFVAPMADADPAVVEWMMRLWPVLLLSVSGILIGTLASRAYPTKPLIEPLAVTTYFFLAWTGQDYWSPQSFGFVLYLAVLVLVESGPLRTSAAWSSSVPFLARFASGGGERPRSRQRATFVALIVCVVGAVVSHPLAPFFICAGLLMLAIYGRGIGWRLILIVAISFVAWFVVNAQPWYATQLPRMVDELGSLFSNLDETTGARVATSAPDHLFVTQVRSVLGIGTILAVLVIGITMALDRYKALRPVIPLAPLAGAPSLALVLGSYGGEIIFRVILFTLPMASILLARLILELPRPAVPLATTVLTVAMTAPFLIARFGNESFEMTTDIDRGAIEAAFDSGQEDDTFYVLDNPFGSYGDRRRGAGGGTALLLEGNDRWVDEVFSLAAEAERERVVVLVTPSMRAWRTQGFSIPEQQIDDAIAWLKQYPGATVIYEQGGGLVLELQRPAQTIEQEG